MKTVVCVDGKRPVYAYQSLKQSLETLFLHQEFREMLHKTRKVQSNVMYDIADGNVYLNFVDNNGNPYFSDVSNKVLW